MEAVNFIKERERMCHAQYSCFGEGHMCLNCIIQKNAHFGIGKSCLMQCEQFESKNPELFVELVDKWSKENPKITNADKFKEVFGAEPIIGSSGYICPPITVRYEECGDCKTCMKWWNEEYKGGIKK